MKLSTETCESILNWLIQRSLDEDFQAAIETGGNYGSNFQELCASSNIFRDNEIGLYKKNAVIDLSYCTEQDMEGIEQYCLTFVGEWMAFNEGQRQRQIEATKSEITSVETVIAFQQRDLRELQVRLKTLRGAKNE